MWENEGQVRDYLAFAVSRWAEHSQPGNGAHPASLDEIPESLKREFFSRRPNGVQESFVSLSNLILREAEKLDAAQREPFARMALMLAVLKNMDLSRITIPATMEQLGSKNGALLERLNQLEKRLFSMESHSPNSHEFAECVRELSNPSGLWSDFEQYLHSHPLMTWNPVKITDTPLPTLALPQNGNGTQPPLIKKAAAPLRDKTPTIPDKPAQTAPTPKTAPGHETAITGPNGHGGSNDNRVYNSKERSQLEGAFSQYLQSQKAFDRYFRLGVQNAMEVVQDALRFYFFGGAAGRMPNFSDISSMFQISDGGVHGVFSDIFELLHSEPGLKRLADLHSAATEGTSELEAYRAREKRREPYSEFAKRYPTDKRAAILSILEACSPKKGSEIPPLHELERRYPGLGREFITQMLANAADKGLFQDPEVLWGLQQMEARREAFQKLAHNFPPLQKAAIILLMEEALPCPKRCEVPPFSELASKFGIERYLILDLMDAAHRFRDANAPGFEKLRILLLDADKKEFLAFRARREATESISRTPLPKASSQQRPIAH